jgi:hypothetical protein
VLLEDGLRGVGGVALGDAAQVQLHAADGEPDGAGALIQPELPPSNRTPGALQRFRIGQNSGFPRRSPQRDHRARGDVEGAS